MHPIGKHIPISNGDAERDHPEDRDSAPPASQPPSAETDAAGDLESLRRQLAEQQEAYLQLKADFEGFIRRSQRDAAQQAASEKEAFIQDLLPILDNLERALASEHTEACLPLHRGVTITLQEVGQLLKRHGIEPVEDVGLPFDPQRHEAVFVQQDPAQPDRVVLAVTQRGYCCNDKVFRPAQVIVNDLSRHPGD